MAIADQALTGATLIRNQRVRVLQPLAGRPSYRPSTPCSRAPAGPTLDRTTRGPRVLPLASSPGGANRFLPPAFGPDRERRPASLGRYLLVRKKALSPDGRRCHWARPQFSQRPGTAGVADAIVGTRAGHGIHPAPAASSGARCLVQTLSADRTAAARPAIKRAGVTTRSYGGFSGLSASLRGATRRPETDASRTCPHRCTRRFTRPPRRRRGLSKKLGATRLRRPRHTRTMASGTREVLLRYEAAHGRVVMAVKRAEWAIEDAKRFLAQMSAHAQKRRPRRDGSGRVVT